MTIKTVTYRTPTGWSAKEKQHVDQHTPLCSLCGSKLFLAPDGKTIYCDQEHKNIKTAITK